MLEGAKLIGAGAATIALAGAAVGIGNVFSSLIHSVARNPSLAKQLFGYAILGFIILLSEAIALFALMRVLFDLICILNDLFFIEIPHQVLGSILSKGISFLLRSFGFTTGGLALFIGFSIRAVLSSELYMNSSDDSFFQGVSDEVQKLKEGGGEVSSKPAEGAEGAGSSGVQNAGPGPREGGWYTDPDFFRKNPFYRVGGKSVESLIQEIKGIGKCLKAEEISLVRHQAEDIMDAQVPIITRMSQLDPERDWLGRGARALANNRTKTGLESVENLLKMQDDLETKGVESETFRKLMDKFF